MGTNQRSGLTLVEVLTAMVLLGTLLVALLAALSRQNIQIERAAKQQRVMQAVETLLADWHLQFGFAPVNEEGELMLENQTYHWRTEPLEQMIDQQLMLGKISFEVFADGQNTPLLSLQLIVPSWDSFD
jgi:prepilin-type N-terminal cleavage/methylation domain-containing protein